MKRLQELKKRLRLSTTGNPNHRLTLDQIENIEIEIELIEEEQKDIKTELQADKAEWDKEIEER